jgi:hypothetical protein
MRGVGDIISYGAGSVMDIGCPRSTNVEPLLDKSGPWQTRKDHQIPVFSSKENSDAAFCYTRLP